MNATVTDINGKVKAAGSNTLSALKTAAKSEAAGTFVQAAAFGAGFMLGYVAVAAAYNAITN